MAGFTRFTGFTVDWTTKATKIAGQATNFKTWLNTRTAELLDWLEDTFLAELESTTDSSSGADKVGMTKLTNYGSAAAATAQAQVEALDTALKANADADATHLAENAIDAHATMPCCRVYNNTAQSIANATDTILAFNSEYTDTEGMHDVSVNNDRITCITNGIYQIESFVAFASNTTGNRYLYLLKNGMLANGFDNKYPVNGAVTVLRLSTLIPMVADDYIQLQVRQTSGGALDAGTNSVPNMSNFMCVKVG